MRSRGKLIQKLYLAIAVILVATLLVPATAFADSGYTDEYGNYVEWASFRNTDTNNAYTDRPTPTNDKEAWGKWAARYGSSWSAAPTPPIIINHKLYIGMGKQVVEIDKETGEALRYSETMPGNVGYAMHSPVYADGKIFIAIENGRICAINIDDLSIAWTTDNSNIIKGQTISPISYVKIDGTGYVYTGTWTNKGGDLFCVSTDDSDVTVTDSGQKIKALTWHFNPAIVDAANLEANNSVAFGYYWTGAYVNENYLAIGSDNGSILGDEISDTAYYTLNPLTGEIIDSVYGIKGMVRSTTVYQDGCLYFSTKDAKVYKIPVDEEGNLGTPSFINMGAFGANAATATPVIYGGRIYLGVSGKGNQFSADGGHGFVVAKDDEVLSQSSFLYTIPVPGYPQAGALLSDFHVNEDFDGDGNADGRVYLFFTYNAKPGGIFYTYDTADQTDPTVLSIEESKIFVPTGDKQEYCISSIVVDEDSTLYYKNDSGYLFAVESNPAALLGLTLKLSSGEEVSLDKEFQSKIPDYKAVVPSGENSVTVVLELEDGVSAEVNGVSYSEGGVQVSLPEDENEVEVVTHKNGKSRTYELVVTKASADCDLATLASAINNLVPSTTNQNVRRMDPDLDPEVTAYTFDWITTGTGSTTGVIDPATKPMMNIFLKASSPSATVKVYPGENVSQPGNAQNPDGTVKASAVSGSANYQWRFPVYSADVTRDSTARIVVTAEDGVTTKEYQITFSRRVYVSEVSISEEEAEAAEGETLQLSAEAQPSNATDRTIIWSSSDESVATVDETGLVTAVSGGSATIRAASADGAYAECLITVHHAELEKTEAKAPTKEEDGNIEYWTCKGCGKIFRDETATEEITIEDTIIKKRSPGWSEEKGTWYYYDEYLEPVTGWLPSGGKWYYMDPATGAMMTGIITVGNSSYYMTESGAMATGWIADGSSWYYAASSGALAKGWVSVGGKWYYMDPETCVMKTGWVQSGSTWYYMNSSGAMATGWVQSGSTWYYMNSSGAMVTGWQKIGATWYFFKPGGAMAANEWYGGYWLGSSGAWTYQPIGSWKWGSGGWWFGDTSGWYARSTTIRINNVDYTFDASGYLVE